ncbi:MAG: AmmeMemoRadiSam system protein B [Spirochaetota bacterium]
MVRHRALPSGWYPATADDIRAQCERWERDAPPVPTDCAAAVVPHAGWAFSGRIAYLALRGLREDADTVVIAGGHLRPDDRVRIAPEDAYETPLGALEADGDLARQLRERLSCADDTTPDNTVEVQLPLVAALLPRAHVLYLRCPPSDLAQTAGTTIAEYAARTGRTICVVGSTDLTHYGPAYGFTPVGVGSEAVEWVRTVNDHAIITAMASLDAGRTIELGNEQSAACSSGAAAAAIAFARAQGATHATVVAYGQSYDVRPDTSFVGYVGICYSSSQRSSAAQT